MPLRNLNYAQTVTYVTSNYTVNLLTRCDLHGREGVYDSNLNTIGLNRNLIYTVKRCVLVHELVHWAYDDPDGAHETRCRQSTALILVDPLEYQLAEQAYGSNPQIIAEQLNLTSTVTEDWQTLADNNPYIVNKAV